MPPDAALDSDGPIPSTLAPETFIQDWRGVTGSEKSNCQSFVMALCALIGVRPPRPATENEDENTYVFERHVRALDLAGDTTSNFIDCYRRGSFVLEAKQSRKRQRALLDQQVDLFGRRVAAGPSGTWDRLMKQARAQAERYAKALPPDHGWPPFLLVVDIGHVIELYADFTGLGKAYLPFPDARTNRLTMDDLAREEVRELLRRIWLDPKSLDPALRRSEATKAIAHRLARLARLLERRHDPKTVALFLMRCLFTGFAEDVGLLPAGAFVKILEQARANPHYLPKYLDPLWRDMDRGSPFNPFIAAPVRHFNGGLFRDATAIALEPDELAELIVAVSADWRNVEPAIFGTLLENALSERERGRLGAQFTPRAYVERLVVPVVIEPLLADWAAVQAAAEAVRAKGQVADAIRMVKAFHRKLCVTRVLDPACGSGNFLYVALELMKRLEAEVLVALEQLGVTPQQDLDLAGHTIGPHQFLGIEKNPRAVPVAELVLWLGHLQWHLRQRGAESLGEPILRPYETIREGDAVLAWSRTEPLRDERGKVRSKCDGLTYKTDPLTGREVPDEAARVELLRYHNPRPADWPAAEFIVGNPPYIAGKDLRAELGDGYAEALWAAYPHLPGGADFVMCWWDKAAGLVRASKVRRFGFITTNSITQTFSRRVVQAHLDAKDPLHLVFAIPDHPWADGTGTAAVRIAMTVGAAGSGEGILKTVTGEGEPNPTDGAVPVELDIGKGRINTDLTIGADVASAVPLQANDRLCSPGVKLHGAGFIVTPAQAKALGLGTVPGLERHIRPYRNGRDLTGRSRNVMVIDLLGLTEAEVRKSYPSVYQHLFDHIKGEREAKGNTPDGQEYARLWWIFGKPRQELRKALLGLNRYIATVETAKHRTFVFMPNDLLPDNMLVNVACDDAYFLGVMSSKFHVIWSLALGGTLEDRPRYTKQRCFDTFPFPDAAPAQRRAIGDLGEELDAHRKRVLAEHPTRLTLTELYNVLEARRQRRALTAREQDIDRLGQVAVIQDLHDRIDRAVAAAYGWPAALPEAEILSRLVALNRARAQEEARGLVRWLRPEFQNPAGTTAPSQIAADLVAPAAKVAKGVWPKDLPAQMAIVVYALHAVDAPIAAADLARAFQGARTPKVAECLAALAAIGRARALSDGRYAG